MSERTKRMMRWWHRWRLRVWGWIRPCVVVSVDPAKGEVTIDRRWFWQARRCRSLTLANPEDARHFEPGMRIKERP